MSITEQKRRSELQEKLKSEEYMQDLEAMEGVDVIHGDHDCY